MKSNLQKTVVFITGAFVHHSCWESWQDYFSQRGFRTHTPPWPFKNASPEELRNSQPNAQIASNRLSALTEYFYTEVMKLGGDPVLVGHSIGGLIVQLLLQRGVGSAGVAIHSVPPQGVFSFSLSFLKAGWGPLGFFTSTKKSFLMSFPQWQYAFTNGMDPEEQMQGYYSLAIPESKLIVRDTITKAAKVKFSTLRAPLLLMAGKNDHSIPASLNYKNFRRYRKSKSITDYKEFEGANHYVLGGPYWKAYAEFILNWLQPHLHNDLFNNNTNT